MFSAAAVLEDRPKPAESISDLSEMSAQVWYNYSVAVASLSPIDPHGELLIRGNATELIL